VRRTLLAVPAYGSPELTDAVLRDLLRDDPLLPDGLRPVVVDNQGDYVLPGWAAGVEVVRTGANLRWIGTANWAFDVARVDGPPGPVAAGWSGLVTPWFGPATRMEVTWSEPGRGIRWHSTAAGHRLDYADLVEPLDDGRCTVTLTATVSGPAGTAVEKAAGPLSAYGQRRRLARLGPSRCGERPLFVPVIVAPEPEPPRNEPPTLSKSRRRRRNEGASIELEIDGVVVRVGRDADAGAIAAVIGALRAGT
jgi:hypothetical protein